MKKNRTFKKFEDWHHHDIIRRLHIQRVEKLPQLASWIDADDQMPPQLLPTLEGLAKHIRYLHFAWNEAEWNFHFFGQMFRSIDFNGPAYHSFLERRLQFLHNDLKISGTVDFMVALGDYEPEQPYFIFHAYKRYKGKEADPLGQLLMAMLAAQYQNNDGMPIYGAYAVGMYWSFVLLDNQQFSESKGFDLSYTPHLHIIWNILSHTKQIIESRVNSSIVKR